MTKNMSVPARLILLALALCTAAAPAQAQITFRAAASATVVTPTFRAAASASTTGATLTIARPAGVGANDVMIASIGVTPSSVVITPPAGWTLVRRINNASATSNSLAVFRKVAGAAEPGSYAWGVSGASFAVGGIQSFFGVNTTTPIDIENGAATASALTHATPNVTTTVANAMVVTSHTYASSRTWTPPTGMSESFDRPSGANSATGQSVEGNRVRQAAAGATGAKTATAEGNADRGNTHILVLRPATLALTISTPAGTLANDVMIASIGVQEAVAVITPPAGWTLVRRTSSPGGDSSLAVYRKIAGASEPAAHTFGLANYISAVGGIQSFSGVDTTTPINVENGVATTNSLTHATPSVTTTVANTMLVSSHMFFSAASWTPPAGMTEAFDIANVSPPVGLTIEGNYVLQAAAGASGVKTATANSGAADEGATHILALRRGNAAPTVSLTSPANGAVFAAPANITLTATAADSDGTITQVEFFQGTTLLATITSAPYTFTLNNVAAGGYSFTAKATDNQGANTTSAAVTVTVNALPTITLTSPANGATFTALASITVIASATDSDGTISQVELFQGTTLLATVTTPPYTFTLTNVQAGSYTFTARATDNRGGIMTTSDPVTVTVASGVAQLYFIYTDQLNTPRVITDQTNKVVWRWDNQDPFGANVPDEDPDQDNQKLTFNPRFPGQYFDRETNLAYNYFRDYDSSTGRYVQVDPIGLAGGINLYGYVNQSPVMFTDSTGQVFDILADIGFIGFDLFKIARENVFGSCDTLSENLAALGADVVGALIPGVTGLGLGVRATIKADVTATFRGSRFREITLQPGTQVQRAFEEGVTEAPGRFLTRGATAERITTTQDAVRELALGSTSGAKPNFLSTFEVIAPVKAKIGFIEGGGKNAVQIVIDRADVPLLREVGRVPLGK